MGALTTPRREPMHALQFASGHKMTKRTITVLAIVFSLFSASLAVNAAESRAATRYYVCNADSVTVRSSPGGTVIGTLYRDQAIDVSYVDGAWSNGYAYGGVNARGWVLSQYLNTSHCAHI
jgi:hypothetical protein